ncbi:polypyrimidine tract-binding protein-like protein 2 [Senna tora]|uniref:Polypyrimidine tract-binding protein-like protein 2 n=1 Tax=Senna tora TaxID=362788 RepID=A0A834WSP0_9FABA|nr:polypyrimidine tract-binding protein-like protein 2 [Senna tora]
MVKLASARDFRTYGPGLTRNRYEYINAGLYLFATVVLTCGFAAQFSSEPKSGLALLLIAFALILIVNFHDLLAHLAGIDFRLPLMELDLQLALVEFGVPITQALGSLLSFLGILFIFIQEEKGYGYFKLERYALNMLVAGPVLWMIGSIHNSCQIYEKANGHVQILQQSVHIPFLTGSLLFLISAILNYYEQSRVIHHGLYLLGRIWVWFGIVGSLLLFIGGFANVSKVFKMQQMDGLRLEKLRGGAQERLLSEREGQVPLILEDQMRRKRHVEDTKIVVPAPTPYKDVLVGHTQTQ